MTLFQLGAPPRSPPPRPPGPLAPAAPAGAWLTRPQCARRVPAEPAGGDPLQDQGHLIRAPLPTGLGGGCQHRLSWEGKSYASSDPEAWLRHLSSGDREQNLWQRF